MPINDFLQSTNVTLFTVLQKTFFMSYFCANYKKLAVAMQDSLKALSNAMYTAFLSIQYVL